MDKPKMILFDYGHTLMHETDYDMLRGQEAVCRYIKSNPRGLTTREIYDFSQELYKEVRKSRRAGYELHEWHFCRMLYETLGIELSVSYPEAEKIFWDNACPGGLMPGIAELLEYLKQSGIRSGVVSNISFSGDALAERINRALPGNSFEFIIATSEYMLRKPSPYIFRLALAKAGLPPEQVWYCGDNLEADVHDSLGVGIYPVWYDNDDPELLNPWRGQEPGTPPDCDCLHIHQWHELSDFLRSMEPACAIR